MSLPPGTARLVVPISPAPDAWELETENTSETVLHDLVIELLVAIFRSWIHRTARDALAGSNLALRWDGKHPNRGVDPDVYVVEPAPPEGELTTSLRLWEKGHHVPSVCVEVVSATTAAKDYDLNDGPARYAAAGVKELWVFDPLKAGPKRPDGSPWTLQVWRRMPKGSFRRVYEGDGPAFSRELGAWLVVTNAGMRLRIANDAAGTQLWPTAAEAAETEVVRLRALLTMSNRNEK
jgi:Uma2 family endonuclease